MKTFEKITTWVIFLSFLALAVGSFGAFAFSWTWHNLLLGFLSIIAALSGFDAIRDNNKNE